MPSLAAFIGMGILSGGGDAAVTEGFLDHFWITGSQVEKMAAGMTKGVAGGSRSFVFRLHQSTHISR